MCGILGFISDKIEHPGEAHQFMAALVSESQRRGRDATGFAALTSEFGFVTDKHARPADDFVRLSTEFRKLRYSDSVSMIGHTRAATNGTPANNKNNHPFHGPRYSLVHNGGVGVFNRIARDYNYQLETHCDSELILHFIESRKYVRDGIANALETLDATSFMAVASLDRDTGDIHLFRNSHSPCVVMKISRWNATVFASSLPIILDASERVFGDAHEIWNWAELSFADAKGCDIPDFSHVVISPSGEISADDLTPQIKTDYTYTSYYGYGYGSWDDDDFSVFSGGTSKYEKSASSSSSTPLQDADKLKSYWRCVECAKELTESLGSVHEVGNQYVCFECWDSLDHAKLRNQNKILLTCKTCDKLVQTDKRDKNTSNVIVCYPCYEAADSGAKLPYNGVIIVCSRPPISGSSVAQKLLDISKVDTAHEAARKRGESIGSILTSPTQPSNHLTFESQLLSTLPSELVDEYGKSDIGSILEALEDSRGREEDYDLDSYELHDYFRFSKPASIEDKLIAWEDMTLEKIEEMSDGEYFAYLQFIEDVLVKG